MAQSYRSRMFGANMPPQRSQYTPLMRNQTLFGAALLVLLVAACSDRNPGAATPTDAGPAEPAGVESVAAAMEKAGSYRLEVEQGDLVLPRSGGSDGGTVEVDLDSGTAYARLFRTGDGDCEVLLRRGQTFFKRESCPTWARIQDGAGVLAAFVLPPGEVRSSRDLGNGEYELAGLGRVSMELDSAGRPAVIRSDWLTGNGQPLTWRFGNPC